MSLGGWLFYEGRADLGDRGSGGGETCGRGGRGTVLRM